MQLCNRLDNKNQHSCMSNKCCSSTIISAGLEPMNANKFFIHTNLPKLKMRLIIVLYATAVLHFCANDILKDSKPYNKIGKQ